MKWQQNPNYYEEVPYDTVNILFMGDAFRKSYGP